MATFCEVKGFIYPWRPYQARILADLETHAADRHFHVVAAPGSGKTVLGLEIMLRLDQPTLIFAPSLGIRDQWIRRFTDLFLQRSISPDWISTDVDAPGALTVSTYQGMKAAVDRQSPEVVLATLQKAGVNTLIFDEAHHLRKSWWECLMQIKEGLEQPFLVSLTATPPYDVSQVEWNRYIALCGEIDEEIPIPELVRERNLCPHQDYIYFSIPGEEERKQLQLYQEGVQIFLGDLGLDAELVAAVQAHPLVDAPKAHMNRLLAESDFALSLAVYLHHAHGVVPEGYRKVLGLDDVELPVFSPGWAEVLLNQLLYRDECMKASFAPLRTRLRERVSSIGAVHQRRVLLKTTPLHARLLRSSISKLYSIAEIVELEYTALRETLRCVVITDYIREDAFPSLDAPNRDITKVGVVPVFEHLRRLRFSGLEIGILSGKIVVLPASMRPLLDQDLRDRRIDPAVVQATPLIHDPTYLAIRLQGAEASRIIEVMTELFQQGHIQVLVGTTALLGEGWDAPAINSLVLATVVGSYMTSNQLRGRAIRVDPRDDEKTANIWHLACVSPGLEAEEDGWESPIQDALTDLPLLERRFKMFVGLSTEEDIIEDGIERTGIDAKTKSLDELHALNQSTCVAAGEREAMRIRWLKVVGSAGALTVRESYRVAREVFVPLQRLPSHPIARYLLQGDSWMSNWMRGRSELNKTRRIARLLLECLSELGHIDAAHAQAPIVVSPGKHQIYTRVTGLSAREESLFTAALVEVFNPLVNPRYLLVNRHAVYAVPDLLGTNKAGAEVFHQAWKKKVERTKLVYSRSDEGRLHLLQARQKFLSGKYHEVVKSRKVWV
jgi:superfamily II DNA or RNA helicase